MFFEDASYKWSVDIVEKFCGIPVPDWGEFHDFNHLKGKFSTAGRYGAARADQRWLRRDFPGSGQRDFPGTPGRRDRGTRSGIPVSSKSEQEVVLLELTRNQQQQERQTAADSCGLC